MSRRVTLAIALGLGLLAIGVPQSRGIEPEAPEHLATASDVIAGIVRQKVGEAGGGAVAAGDREALVSFYAARQSRLVWVGERGLNARAKETIAEIRRADEWGLRAAAFELPDANASEPEKLADAELKISYAALKYARHARGGRFNPSELSPDLDVRPQLYDPSSLIKALAEAEQPGGYLRRLHPKNPQFEKLREMLNEARRASGSRDPEPAAETRRSRITLRGDRGKGAARRPAELIEQEDLAPIAPLADPATAANGPKIKTILANMERWRYLPDDLGRLHVMANVPEFEVRVVKDGRSIHAERIVVGKLDKQTTIFSSPMQEIVFQPYWHVPNSIKAEDIAPELRKGLSILQRQNLGIRLDGRDVDPASVDWNRTDLRKFEVYQPPGGLNVLGQIKFAFPNKHDIYMHDTPTKNLFERDVRAESHGCMRVRNPKRLAEILLGEDKGWGAAQVAHEIAIGNDTHVALNRKIPVHVVYFTIWIDEQGKPHTFDDLYGHDWRMIQALDGRPAYLVGKEEPPGMAAKIARLAQNKPKPPVDRQQADPFLGWLLN